MHVVSPSDVHTVGKCSCFHHRDFLVTRRYPSPFAAFGISSWKRNCQRIGQRRRIPKAGVCARAFFRPHPSLRPVCTPTTFYKPPDSVQMRVLYEQHFQNVAQEEPCAWDCTMPNCSNRVRTDMVRIGPSNLLRGESGLFARENITVKAPSWRPLVQ